MQFAGINFWGANPDKAHFLSLYMDGFQDDTMGEAEYEGHFILFETQGAIIMTDERGNTGMADFSTPEETYAAWEKISNEIDAMDSNDHLMANMGC